jgi:glyoxylase-like metal-dependent hydrolase (beta-lactamase superfamily II)
VPHPESLPDAIHDLALTAERDGDDLTIHPAAVETPRGLLLVDVGLASQFDDLKRALSDRGHSLSDAWAVLLTHQDGDHAGALSRVMDEAAPVVLAHRDAAPYVDGREHPLKGPDDDRYPPVGVDVELTDGATLRTDVGAMEVVETPGHTPGHASLYFPDERFLLAGDALTADGEGVAGPPEEFTLDLVEATRSVGVLADYRTDSILCYHGGPVEADADDVETVYDDLAAKHDVA